LVFSKFIFAVAAVPFHGLVDGPIYIVYLLAFVIPSLAVSVRRLLDIGKSGAYISVVVIPIVDEIWFFCSFLH